MRRRLLPLLLCLFAASVFAANQATLTWTYDTVTWPTVTFNVYQGPQGQPKAKVLTGVTPLTATINTGLISGSAYCWEVTAVVGSSETGPSNEACKTFPPNPSSLTVK